ncbi:hypothetical protein [Aliisedimentitalea sp. MJ-SS2]|uniref:hypothetical protein n=1 Tax=Aliisedimentitalea sp. MJ-SS2 TaxID=3049795 RepID=UPI00292FFEBC|nr:hypothetical protein [Alisedimentitalea sp. MJ-SS2]
MPNAMIAAKTCRFSLRLSDSHGRSLNVATKLSRKSAKGKIHNKGNDPRSVVIFVVVESINEDGIKASSNHLTTCAAVTGFATCTDVSLCIACGSPDGGELSITNAASAKKHIPSAAKP